MNDATTTVTNQAAPADKDEARGLPRRAGAPSPGTKGRSTSSAPVVLVAACCCSSRCFAGEAEGGYATETVRRGSLTVTVSATGNLQPTNQVEVGSEQSGLVTQVFVDNNDRVDRRPAARPARYGAAAGHDRPGPGRASPRPRRRSPPPQASAAQARANLARQEEVFRVSGGRVPSRDRAGRRPRREPARASPASAPPQAQVAQARAQLSSAQTNLSKATIYSPVTGVVLSRQIDPGQTVAASFQAPVLFTIAEDLAAMKLEVRVDEADVGQVREGQRASFTVDAYPGRTFPAMVTRIDVGANASGVDDVGIDRRRRRRPAASSPIPPSWRSQNPELLLRPGMTATAEIVTTERRNALLVPNAALRWSPERDAAAQRGQQGGITSVLVPRGGRGGRGGGGGGGASARSRSAAAAARPSMCSAPTAIRRRSGSSSAKATARRPRSSAATCAKARR